MVCRAAILRPLMTQVERKPKTRASSVALSRAWRGASRWARDFRSMSDTRVCECPTLGRLGAVVGRSAISLAAGARGSGG